MATVNPNAEYRRKIGAWVKARLLANPKALRIEAEGLDLFVVRDVLPPDLCADMIALVDRHLVPSGIMSPHPDPEYRTSYSGNPPPDDPTMVEVDRRIREVVGIQKELGETIQGQRYAVGQQFKPHWDFFVPSESYYPKTQAVGGQRTWTAMAFLNEPEAGGYTRFTAVDVAIRPRVGNLVVWNNLDENGDPNERSMHQGCPVEAGLKYIVTKWYRERAWEPMPDD